MFIWNFFLSLDIYIHLEMNKKYILPFVTDLVDVVWSIKTSETNVDIVDYGSVLKRAWRRKVGSSILTGRSRVLKIFFIAVQNERDRISCRRPSYEENTQGNGLSVSSLLNAEMLSRQVGAALEVIFLLNFRCLRYVCDVVPSYMLL